MLNILDSIKDIEENIKYNLEYNHYYIIDVPNKKLYIKEDYEPKELLKDLDDVDMIVIDDINHKIYVDESYKSASEYCKDRYDFKYLNKIVIKLWSKE